MVGVSAKAGPAAAAAIVALLAAGSLLAPAHGPEAGAPLLMEAGRTSVAFHADGISLSPATADGAYAPTIALLFEHTPGVPPVRGPGGEVRYSGLWGGVELRYTATALGPKYELVVPPSADLDRISLRADGGSTVQIAQDGRLHLAAGAFEVTDSPLVAWDASGASVNCRYEMRGTDSFGFSCPDWTGDLPLTIDPLLLSTFIGGSQRDEAEAVAFDPSGNIVVVGWTSSDDFPLTAFSPDQDATGGDAFIAKFSADGTTLLWATYLGGSGFEVAFAVACEASGKIWVAGETNSANFYTTADAVQRNASGGMDAFLARLSADGLSIEYATYLGGAGWDRALGLALGAGGDPFLTGETNSTAFPTTAGPPLHNGTGPLDAFVARVNASSGALTMATLLGGNATDAGRAIALGASGTMIVAGSTNSSDLPAGDTFGAAVDTTYNGGVDAFVTAMWPSNGTLATLTYLGGSADDYAFTIDTDSVGYPYVGGLSASADFPTTAGVLQQTAAGSDEGFIAKMTTSGGIVTAATFLGGDGSEGVVGLTVAPDGTLTAVGFTDSANFPVTMGAMRTSRSGSAATSYQEAFFSRISADLTTLHYSSYMGEAGTDIARAVAVDGFGIATVVGATDASGFPTTSGAIDRILNGTEGFLFRAMQRRPNLAISTNPAGRVYTLNGTALTTPITGPCSEGVSLPISIASPQIIGGVRYLFTNWSDGAGQNRTVQCLADQTIEARFTMEVLASLSTDPTGLWLLVDGVNVTAPWSAWWPAGGTHTAEAATIHSRSGTRYLFTGWADGGPAARNLSATAPITILAQYTADAYSFEMFTDPPGRTLAVDGLNFTCPAAIWLAIGSGHLLVPPSPQPDSPGLRYAFTNWSDGSVVADKAYTAAGPASFFVTFTAEFEIRLDSDPPGLPVTIDLVETTMPWSGWRLNGTGMVIAPPSAPPERDGVLYGAMSWSDLGASARSWTVWRPESLTALFQPVAYELVLASNPPDVPISLEGSSQDVARTFQAPNAQLSVSAPANFTNGTTRYTFQRWSDAGIRSHFIGMTGPLELTAFFSQEFEVRFGAAPGDTVFRVDGVAYLGSALMWMDEGSVHTLTASEIVPGGTGRRLAFVSWSDGGGAAHTYTAAAAEVLNLTYRTEVLLTIKSPSGDPTCDIPNCWYPQGAEATVTVKSPWNESAGQRDILRGWLGNDSASGSSAVVIMGGPSELTVLWGHQFYLSVTTRYGVASGSGWYDEGVGASFNLSTAEASAGGARFHFKGWSGDQLSTGTNGLVFMDGPKSVVAVWEEVHAAPAEAPLWLLVPLIVVGAGAAALVVVRRRSKAKQLERAWKKPDEFEPVDPPGQR